MDLQTASTIDKYDCFVSVVLLTRQQMFQPRTLGKMLRTIIIFGEIGLKIGYN